MEIGGRGRIIGVPGARALRHHGDVIVLGLFVAAAAAASLVALAALFVAGAASALAVGRLAREDRRRRADLERVLDEVLASTGETV